MAGYIGNQAQIRSGLSATIDELNIIDGVTATTAELNILDGVTSTATELNILDGVTATTAELNIMDGVTATTAELNIMDGVTATAAEINLIDGGTARGTTAIADGDGVLINDAGTMRQTSVETLATYMGTKGLGPAYTRAATPPGSPNQGDWWLDTARGEILYIYDGTLGWLSSKGDEAFGQGHYTPSGSFSMQFDGTSTFRFTFEGLGLGNSEAGPSVPDEHRGHGEISWALSNSVRGVFNGANSGESTDAAQNHIAFLIMATNADAADFGDLTANRSKGLQCASHATRGVMAGGERSGSVVNIMDYVTIASAGDATDFGNLSVARRDMPSQAMSSTTRSVFGGGDTGSNSDVLDYITVGSTGNATDFGNLTGATEYGACANSTTRGLHAAGNGKANSKEIDFITIGTTGNAGDFGDLALATLDRTAVHSATVAYFHAGAEQVTMATAANATASGVTFGADGNYQSVMPGWLAYNG